MKFTIHLKMKQLILLMIKLETYNLKEINIINKYSINI